MYSVSSFSVVQPLDNWSHQCVEKKEQKSEVSFRKTSFWYYLQIGHLVSYLVSNHSYIFEICLKCPNTLEPLYIYVMSCLLMTVMTTVWYVMTADFLERKCLWEMVQYHKSTYLSQKHSSPYKHLSVHDCLKISWFFHCVHCQTWSVIKHSTESVSHSLVNIEKYRTFQLVTWRN